MGKHFRTDLASSSLSSPDLFDAKVLERVSADSHVDSSLNAQLSIAKAAVSLPVFGAGKVDRKASSDPSSSAASSSAPSRGRGRGLSFLRGRGQKRKPGSLPEASKPSKSPKRTPKSPRGKGFPK